MSELFTIFLTLTEDQKDKVCDLIELHGKTPADAVHIVINS